MSRFVAVVILPQTKEVPEARREAWKRCLPGGFNKGVA